MNPKLLFITILVLEKEKLDLEKEKLDLENKINSYEEKKSNSSITVTPMNRQLYTFKEYNSEVEKFPDYPFKNKMRIILETALGGDNKEDKIRQCINEGINYYNLKCYVKSLTLKIAQDYLTINFNCRKRELCTCKINVTATTNNLSSTATTIDKFLACFENTAFCYKKRN